MIPIKLEFEAFGPFAKKQIIDFREFENDRLFLISGQTGSGKTTIFDAITFALFGQASGYTRQSDSFKSDFADVSTVCYVRFDFMVKGKSYSIHREPIQWRKKRNGNVVMENSTATLTLENGDILSGPNTVNKYIEELLGISADQFKKIVMLPQGEFRRFLSDDSVEKQKILRKIFGTKILDDFTEQLRANANQLKSALEATYTECATLISSISCLDNEKLSSEVSKEQKDILSTLALLKDFNQQLEFDVKEQKEKIQNLNKEKEKLNIPYYKEINAKFEQLESTKSELAKLESQAEEVAKKKGTLALLKKVKEITPLYYVIEQEKQKLSDATQKQTLYQTELEQASKALKQCDAEYQVLKAEQQALPQYLQKIETLKKQLEIFEEIASLQKALSQISKDIKTLSENEIALTNLRQYVTLQNEISELKTKSENLKQCKDALAVYDNAAQAFLAKKQAYQLAFHHFINGQASLLAQNLVDGEACPVCGSTNHPNPAKLAEHMVSQEELDVEKRVFESATQALERAQSNLLMLLKNNELEQEKIDSTQILNLIHQNEAEILKQIESITHQADKITLRDDLIKIQPLPKIEQIDKKIVEQQQNLAAQKGKQENIKLQLDALSNKIDETQNYNSISQEISEYQEKVNKINVGLQTIESKRNELSNQVAKLEEGIAQTKIAIADLNTQLQADREKFEHDLAEISVNQTSFTDYLVELEKIETLEKEITDFNQNIAIKREIIASLSAQLKDLSPVNLIALQQQANQIEAETNTINQRYIAINAALIANNKIYHKLKAKQQQYTKLSKEFGEVNKLFEVANGKYSDKLNFERYVLATYFNDVITNANLRLEQMTSSRYTLIRRTEKEKGNKSSGLSLDVFDAFNGKTRNVNTLSGGESFKVALALALGMADIISENSGGIEINTLFIDEGFGSLDPLSLDQAIECLYDLRSSGRYIGIISHVNELKEKIPAKINVIQQPTGSYIESN